jgi:hypothetical protein
MTLEYASVDAVKARANFLPGASQADIDLLTKIVGQVNDYIEFFIGCPVGPSTETTFTLDGRDAKAGGKMLRIPAGIRSLTTLTVDTSPVTPFYLRPKFPLSGWPYQEIWLDEGRFTDGFDNVAGSGAVLGFAAIPANLSEIAEVTSVRAWFNKTAGQKDQTGSDANGNPMVSRYISARDRETLNEYCDRIGIKKRAMSVEME